ncbi:hypothetical protein BLS_003894 [Venturia inaequalis]|uniref:Cell wall protein n=1 Tax=Venturia inaequalis TaxID=5025 RepID=A0A8H3UKR2_VENIN|nr:hypothetical protein EG328_006286 [Venturia inaequalis]KAE9972788.1 hypothetical protein BLS_003894 [Venturia inaequalis]KAE9973600.1 hypothetical protein EG327_009026 [Venturia inaequalis]RDI77425.1 hypothetical protein Vi05172_g12628 [Venturia inaequalis]
MKFTQVLSLGMLLGSTVAAPTFQKRDAKPLIDALTNISKTTQSMTTAVTAFTGDAADGAKILTQAEGLLKVLDESTATLGPLPVLPLNEAVQVLAPGNALIADVQKVTDALIAKKEAFNKNSLGSVVGDTLTKFKGSAEKLVAAITQKLPPNVASVGATIGKQVNASLDKGIAAFK